MKPITPCLWFDGNAEEAATLYTGLFPDSRITKVLRAPADNPSMKKGGVLAVEFTLNGQPFSGLNGGPQFPFTEAVSFTVATDTQDETDHYWDTLIAEGGEAIECGWLKDRFGLRWQIYPARLQDLMAHGDSGVAERAMQAMLTMQKIDIAAIERAALEN